MTWHPSIYPADDLGPLPIETPRQRACQIAERELNDFLLTWRHANKITAWEEVHILSEVISRVASTYMFHERTMGKE